MKTVVFFILASLQLIYNTSGFANQTDYAKLHHILPLNIEPIWFSNQEHIASCFHQRRPKIVVEVGSWLGVSTAFMAKMLPEDGMIFAVDPWETPTEIMSQGYPPLNWPIWPVLYEQFLSNMFHYNVETKVTPIRATSVKGAEVMKKKNIKIDLIYIDANHDTEPVLEDLRVWYPLVEGHGLLCGDDWCWPTVRDAVYQFAVEKNLQVYGNGNFWAVY